MFQRFTDEARQVVTLAPEEARLLNHDHLGTEHLLLAFLHVDTGVGARALESLGITEETARQQVEEIVGRGQPGPQRGHFLYTPQAKKALELSLYEAETRGDASVGTEHLLLGLIGVGEGPAAQVLNRPGVDLNRVCQQVIQQMSANRGKDDPETGRQ